jgi:ribose transport system substrate-binding protein
MEEINQRQLSLLKSITKKKYYTIKELSERFNLSRETIRKELVLLEKTGLIIRKNGKIQFQDTEENTELLESSGVLTKEQRHQRILQILKQDKEVRITTLANKLKVSVLTIRNDLKVLELTGTVLKKHGSAVLFEPSIPTTADNKSGFNSLTSMLGQYAIMHIKPQETIFLDSGDVSRYVATSLPPYTNLSIWTNSLDILDDLRARSYAYPVQTFGFRVSLHNKRFCLSQEDNLPEALVINRAIICCKSYASNTFYLADEEDLPSIVAVCERAQKIYIVLDSNHLELQGKTVFPYKRYLPKIREVLIDDGIGSFRANVLFSRQDPLIICGLDYTYRNVRKYQHRIGFLVNKDRNYFVQAVHNSLLEATAACKSVSLIIRECDGDYASTVQTLNMLLDEQVDLVIDYSLCMESLMYIGEKCLARNVKLISVDYMAPGAIYFGADNAKAGTIAGEQASRYIHDRWNSKLDHLLVLGKYGYEPITKLRISSALEHIQLNISLLPDTIHTIEWGHPEKDPTQALVQLLKDIPKEENMLILAFNLRHLLSSHDLILQYRECENTIIVSHNYTKQIEELMKIGKSPILGCVHYNPEGYGEKIMDIALRLLEGGAVQPRNYTNLTWIEKTY